MTEDKHSPLHDWHVAHGAEVVWEDGYPWAMHEGGDPMAEYEAVRTATGIWDLFSTCKYEVTGPDAARVIQRRFTNSLAGMADGSVRYGAFVNADGLDGRRRQRLQVRRRPLPRDDQHRRHRRTGSARRPTGSTRRSSTGPMTTR